MHANMYNTSNGVHTQKVCTTRTTHSYLGKTVYTLVCCFFVFCWSLVTIHNSLHSVVHHTTSFRRTATMFQVTNLHNINTGI
jgi:preprotein translocase subunit SecG